jgi:hypothetical protein
MTSETSFFPQDYTILTDVSNSDIIDKINNDSDLLECISADCWGIITKKDGKVEVRYDYYKCNVHGIEDNNEFQKEDIKRISIIDNFNDFLNEFNDEITAYMFGHGGFRIVASLNSNNKYTYTAYRSPLF